MLLPNRSLTFCRAISAYLSNNHSFLIFAINSSLSITVNFGVDEIFTSCSVHLIRYSPFSLSGSFVLIYSKKIFLSHSSCFSNSESWVLSLVKSSTSAVIVFSESELTTSSSVLI